MKTNMTETLNTFCVVCEKKVNAEILFLTRDKDSYLIKCPDCRCLIEGGIIGDSEEQEFNVKYWLGSESKFAFMSDYRTKTDVIEE